MRLGEGGVRLGEGGCVQFGPYFSAFLKKKEQGHFLTQKESRCAISADSEQLGKSLQNRHLGPACMDPFN